MNQDKNELENKNNQEQDLQVILEKAQLHHRSGNLEKAEDLYRHILGQEPNNSQATQLLGLLSLQSGKYSLAHELFATAIELDSQNPVIYSNQATTYWLEGDQEKAITLFQKALEIEPEYAEAHANLGKIFKAQERLQEAREHLRKGINNGDTNTDTFASLAQVHYDLGDMQKAERNARSAILGTLPTNIGYSILIHSLCAQDRALEAITVAEEYKEKEPFSNEPKKMLAKAYQEAGMPELANIQNN